MSRRADDDSYSEDMAPRSSLRRVSIATGEVTERHAVEEKAEQLTEAGTAPLAKGVRFYCDYCRSDITQLIRIRCAECENFDLCLQCFSNGVELFDHRNDHKYRVIEHVTTPIYDAEWGANEELLLLEGIQLFGFGNWSDIAEHVGSKTRLKCELHYNAVYMAPSTAPLPDESLGVIDSKEYKKMLDFDADALAGTTNTDNAAPGGVRSGSSRRRSSICPSGLSSLIGYHVLRGDFDVEYDNDFEKLIADIEFFNTDSKAERNLKFNVLELYGETLTERKRRKDFIIERNLLDTREKRRTEEEREIARSLNVFAQYQSKEEHDEFVDGLILEYRLRKRIEKLQEHKLLGIETIAEGEKYEMDKRKRDMQEAVRREKDAALHVQTRRNSRTRQSNAHGTVENGAKRARVDTRSRNTADTFEIAHLPKYNLLSQSEQQLCAAAHLAPAQYLLIRDSVIAESFARGLIDPESNRQLLRIDVNKSKKLFDIVVRDGWDYESKE